MIKSKSPAQGPNRRSPRTVLNLASCLLYLWECSLHEKNHYLNSGKVTAFFPATHLRKACPQCSYFLPRKRNSAYGRLPLNPPARILSPAWRLRGAFPIHLWRRGKTPKWGSPGVQVCWSSSHLRPPSLSRAFSLWFLSSSNDNQPFLASAPEHFVSPTPAACVSPCSSPRGREGAAEKPRDAGKGRWV